MKELKARESHHDRLIIRSPSGGWLSRIDPNASGIMLNIHFENALKHTRGDLPVHVDASQMGRVVISNHRDTLAPEDLDVIKQRFKRKGPMSDGYCLGLSIVHELCNHSGCTVELISPQSGKHRGSTAILNIPLTRE
ncbi:sensor histidine kinase [Sulfitobacter sp. MF3-043]|uniref:sensor histidine kinase n=1 Tax=Sulfitobacter sediminivivens TaxID=3252902 RepID=UPI003EBE294E